MFRKGKRIGDYDNKFTEFYEINNFFGEHRPSGWETWEWEGNQKWTKLHIKNDDNNDNNDIVPENHGEKCL